jgi:hypothetical protein
MPLRGRFARASAALTVVATALPAFAKKSRQSVTDREVSMLHGESSSIEYLGCSVGLRWSFARSLAASVST